MEWNDSTVEKLSIAFHDKYKSMFGDVYQQNIDRKNRSALWNKYIKHYDCKVIRNDVPGKKSHAVRAQEVVVGNLIRAINFNNESVTNSLVIRNPDRYGQYILISRDMAERILAIGMI